MISLFASTAAGLLQPRLQRRQVGVGRIEFACLVEDLLGALDLASTKALGGLPEQAAREAATHVGQGRIGGRERGERFHRAMRRGEAVGTERFVEAPACQRRQGRTPGLRLGIVRIERAYGAYTDQRLQTKVYHKGIDIRVPPKTLVKAVFDGKIAYADWFVGYGKIVIVDHDGEYFTLYAHLSDILKSVGDQVVVGEPIAKVGDTGSLKGAYLYFELRKKGISENPEPWFANSRR